MRRRLHLIALILLGTYACAVIARAGTSVELRVEANQPGSKIDRNSFGQFAEHTGIYGGVWVGKESPIPNMRGIRSDVVAAGADGEHRSVRWLNVLQAMIIQVRE